MKFDLSINNNSAALALNGDLDRDSLSQDFWLLLSAQQKSDLAAAKQLTVNLKGSPRADTAGLAWLINLLRDANTQNIEVIFSHVPTKLLNLADLSGAKHLLQA